MCWRHQARCDLRRRKPPPRACSCPSRERSSPTVGSENLDDNSQRHLGAVKLGLTLVEGEGAFGRAHATFRRSAPRAARGTPCGWPQRRASQPLYTDAPRTRMAARAAPPRELCDTHGPAPNTDPREEQFPDTGGATPCRRARNGERTRAHVVQNSRRDWVARRRSAPGAVVANAGRPLGAVRCQRAGASRREDPPPVLARQAFVPPPNPRHISAETE